MSSYPPSTRRGRTAERLAKGLGWFSIGLGLAELIAPRALGRATHLRSAPGLVRSYGLREIGTGIGLLAARNKTPWLWARVGGDALDLATLATRTPLRRTGTLAAVAAVVGVAALDLAAARSLQRRQQAGRMVRDYSGRRGFPRPVQEMHGAARVDFETPPDMRSAPTLRAVQTA